MKNQKAFTLVELLVVISIIALLMSILMPSLQMVKQKAAGIVCAANVRSLSQAWLMYAQSNDDKIVCSDLSVRKQNSVVVEDGQWVRAPMDENGNGVNSRIASIEDRERGIGAGALYPYVGDTAVYHCHSDRRYKTTGAYRTYSIPTPLNGCVALGDKLVHKKLTSISRPGQKVVFIEENDNRLAGINQDSWIMGPMIMGSGRGGGKPEPFFIDAVADWHRGSSTLAYIDGHAEAYRWKNPITSLIAQNFSDYNSGFPIDGVTHEELKYPQDRSDVKYIHDRYPRKY